MIKRTIILQAIIIFCLLPVSAQVKKQETAIKREVTLYNPYKPSLPEAKKRSFLPDMNDTMKVRPDIHYDIITKPFLPAYTVSPLKPAALLPDPLTKLYKSFVNIGFGNYMTPLGEISITNERSKKGSIGFYGRHLSGNGKVELENAKQVFAGFMDNDASVFGRKFLKKNVFESSVDLAQRTRYAYGYDTSITSYSPSRKDTRLSYYNVGVNASLSSLTLDSTHFSYKFDIHYNYFHNTREMSQNNLGIGGVMSKSFNGFYVGSGISYNYYAFSDSLLIEPKYTFSVSPFLKKNNDIWSFKLGFQAVLDKNMTETAEVHLYPDLNFSFSVVPTYIKFFAGLSGKLERNDPMKVISENPFLVPDGSLFKIPNTDHELIVTAGLKGNTGLNGNYLLSASYSLLSDMLFYTNFSMPDNITHPYYGNYFLPVKDDAELLNIHGELNGAINDKLTFNGSVNFYDYSLSTYQFAIGKPGWDGKLGLKYSLRDKIIAGMELTAQGKRRMLVTANPSLWVESSSYFNLNLTAEYRYSKILSFWTRFNNISTGRYFEWAYYPTQRFQCMVGFTYSL